MGSNGIFCLQSHYWDVSMKSEVEGKFQQEHCSLEVYCD